MMQMPFFRFPLISVIVVGVPGIVLFKFPAHLGTAQAITTVSDVTSTLHKQTILSYLLGTRPTNTPFPNLRMQCEIYI